MPSALENIFKSSEDKPKAPPRNKEKDDAKRQSVFSNTSMSFAAI